MLNFEKLRLHTKIALLLLFSILISCSILAVYFGLVLSQNINESSLNMLKSTSQNAAGIISAQNSQIEVAALLLKNKVEADFNYSRALSDSNYFAIHESEYYEYEKQLLEYLNNSGLGAVAIYVTYSVEDFNAVNEVWFVIDKNGVAVIHENESFDTFDPSDSDMDWYYLPKSKRLPLWTRVYNDSQTGVRMISYVVPFYSHGRFAGVIGIDQSLESEQQIVQKLDSSLIDTDVFLLDAENQYIIFPTQVVDSSLISAIASASAAKTDGYVYGDKQIVYFSVLNNGHKVVSILPSLVLSSQISRAFWATVAVCLFVIGVFSLIGFFFSNSLTSSLGDLQFVSREVGKGNFKVRAKVIQEDELGELANTLNKTIDSLERMDEEHKQLEKAKTEFLSITSHELRSPMTPMKAQLQMLKEGYFGKLNPKQGEAVDIVLRNTVRLDNIILDFLEISRIEAARLKFNFTKTSLNSYVERLKDEMDAFLPEKKITVQLNVPLLPIIEVDPDRVMQVLRNLVNNAKKFSSEKSKIIISAKVVDKSIEFSVKDFGEGIPVSAQKRIFEPFFQAEQTMYRKVGGNGLGLTICKGIIESQGGKIWFESVEKKGTTFYFTIPFEPVKEGKSIKLLFSSKSDEESRVLELFKEYLGPLGEKEFYVLMQSKGITLETLVNYVGESISLGILDTIVGEEFKNKLSAIYVDNLPIPNVKESVSEEDLAKLIK
jgi:signal transduction histidine kinase